MCLVSGKCPETGGHRQGTASPCYEERDSIFPGKGETIAVRVGLAHPGSLSESLGHVMGRDVNSTGMMHPRTVSRLFIDPAQGSANLVVFLLQ